jgi:HEAT repeat protein
MPFLIEHVTEVVFAILIALLLGNGFLIAIAITRRQRREKYFQRIDELRQQYHPVITGLLAGQLDYQRGLETLKGISGLDRDFILEQLCLEKPPAPTQVPILRRLCEDLGLVKTWQRYLTGEFSVATFRDALSRPEGLLQRVGRLSFLLRAKSAENLGTILHQPSWPLLIKALDDPHTDVQSVALRSLAAIAEPQSFLTLVERLHEVVLKPSTRLSLRSVKTALVSFPLKQAPDLRGSLRHSHRRIRFLATDIIREMVERQAASDEDFVLEPKVFPAELAEFFLTQLCFDENADVRARTAPVIAYLPDPRSVPVLLTLLEDSQWFVRLHAVRALAKRKFLPQAADIARRLTDPNWMVRGAAAQTLLGFGQLGINQLLDHFLSTQDRYSREQIADEMQRAEIIPTLLTQYANAADGKESQVIEQLAQMGKTSYFIFVLVNTDDRNLRKKFLEGFGRNPDLQIQAWVKELATRESDAELRALAQASISQQKK